MRDTTIMLVVIGWGVKQSPKNNIERFKQTLMWLNFLVYEW